MFTLEKGDGSLTLRPEGTAGIARAYLEAGYARRAPVQRLFTIGPMFRYERPQKGRERQFTQFDVECLGSLDPRLDAELVDLAARFFEELGLGGVEVRLNSMGDGQDRDRYREAVRVFLAPQREQRCELCRSRFERNVLRVLDCKNERCKELSRAAPKLIDFLTETNRAHFEAVRAALARIGRRAEVDPGIVRGLDYYTRTVFELHQPSLGARSALCGGGRYDHLLRDLGGPDLGAVGFAVGFSGTLIVLEQLGLAQAVSEGELDVYAVAADESARGAVFELASELRAGGVSAVFDVEQRGLKAQMKQAGGGGFRLALVLGERELAEGTLQLKQLSSGEQTCVARAGALEAVRKALGRAP
jgi:histidyl-tRNA synthetase